MDKDYTFEKKKTEDEQTELTIKVNKDKFMAEKAKTYKKLSANIAIPGFRPGKGPDNLLEAKMGTNLYEETINKLIPEITLKVLQDEKLNPLSQIKYQLKKATNEEGLEYTATFVELPQIKLSDFKKIKPKTEEIKVTEEEVDKTINQLVEINRKRKEPGAKEEHTHDHGHDHDHNHDHHDHDHNHDHHDHDHKHDEKDAPKKIEKVTDAEVKELGLGFDTVEKLREELKKRIEQEKKIDQESQRLEHIIAEAVKMSDIKVPKALTQSEVERHEHDYTHKVEDLGLKLEDFLKSQNTTIEEQRKKWLEEARKRLETELLLIEIARSNGFTISDAEIQAEIDQIKDAKLKAEYNTGMGKRYISSVLVQQKAIKWLRDQVEQVKS